MNYKLPEECGISSAAIERFVRALEDNHMFTHVPRIILASLAGFLLGELSNAWIMEKIKVKTQGRWLWLRTISSSMIAYILDTIPFVLIAFAGVVSTHDLMMMIVFQYINKLLIESVLGTPMAYSAIRLIQKYYRKKELTETV